MDARTENLRERLLEEARVHGDEVRVFRGAAQGRKATAQGPSATEQPRAEAPHAAPTGGLATWLRDGGITLEGLSPQGYRG